MTAILARLREDYGYSGSYSAVRRYIHQRRPAEPRVTMRVYTAPGEEAQVDFGSIGQLYDPRQGRPLSRSYQTLLDDRPLDRLRSVQAILRLEQSVTARRLEAACACALFYGDVTCRRIKQILNAALDCEPLPEQGWHSRSSPHADTWLCLCA